MVLCCASGAGAVCLASKVAPIVFKHAHPELPHRAAVFCGAPHVDLVLLDSNAEYQADLAGAALLVQGLFWLLAGYLPCFLCLKALDYPWTLYSTHLRCWFFCVAVMSSCRRCVSDGLPRAWMNFSTLTSSYCLHFERDVAAAWAFHAIRLVYDWASLGRALPLLNQIWFRFVKQNVLLPTAVLAAGDRLNKRLPGAVVANFPDEQLSLPWPMQREAVVGRLHASMEADSAASSAAPRTPVGRPTSSSVPVLDSPDLRSLQPMLEIESSPEHPPKRATHSESSSDSKDWVWHFMKMVNIMRL